MECTERDHYRSSLWQIKQKGTWPIAPRDSVLITTTYKSPGSVHIFSVSTDDSKLFPSIQPPPLGYIRTRTEILGWSIESLSPTTTQITLIDQHDPLGWSPKSWTPAQLIAQVAGVGEFALKSGGPPMITRIAGAKVTSSKYEHDKGTFRAEYSKSDHSLASTLVDPSDFTNSFLEPSDTCSVECELRCDCESWASSLEVVVDPPPAKVNCLKRHKLSSGGGWWITIEHDPVSLGQDRVKILIRKGKTGLDDKDSVILNGNSLNIDVEELSAEQAKSLATQRRVKASLIPLDQYSLSGPRTRKSPGTFVSDSTVQSSASKPDPIPREPVAGPASHVASLTPIPTQSRPPKPLRLSHPMASALEALAHLQTFHIEQRPDIMVPPLGWTLVTEKGSASVYKKTVPQISETFPVYRADQVIQGVTAEEMVATLCAVSSRPLWDDRLETARLLDSYGYGCTTHLLTTKPTFPFKARLLQTANVHATFQVPRSSIGSHSATIHFIASASWNKSGEEVSRNCKVNPQGLVLAHMFLEGWVMETVDPYSSSSHEIPSTRCTYFSAIDYGGSLPVALNSMLNSGLPRTISGLEMLVKSHGPLPRLCQPVFGLGIDGSLKMDETIDWKWKLDAIDSLKTVVLIDARPKSPFQAMFLLHKGANEPTNSLSPTQSACPPSAHSTSRYESIKKAGTSLTSINDQGTASTPVRRLVSTPDLHRAPNAGQTRKSGASWTPNPHGAHIKGTKSRDLVVAELALDRKFYPLGCRVSWKANFLKSGTNAIIEPGLNFPFPPDGDTLILPLKVSVHQMPSPAIFAASLDPSSRREHLLLRMTLPVGEIHFPIKDPLTSNSDSEVSTPPFWYSQMSKRAVVVHLLIEQFEVTKSRDPGDPAPEHPRSVKKNAKFQMIVNGEMKRVIPIEESQAELDRKEVNDYMGAYPLLSRSLHRIPSTIPKRQVSQPTPSIVMNNILPSELEQPLAYSLDFRMDPEDATGSSSIPGSVVETPDLLSPVNEVKELQEEISKNTANVPNALEVNCLNGNQSQGGRFDYFKKFIFCGDQSLQRTNFFNIFKIKRRTYTNRHLVLTALISFLLGSILRSMLIPSDYLIIPPSPPSSSVCYTSSCRTSTTLTSSESDGDLTINQKGSRYSLEPDHYAGPKIDGNDHQSQKHSGGGWYHHQAGCHFKLSDSDKQLLRLLETRNHWKEVKKIFEIKLNFLFSHFRSSWSVIIGFVKN